MFTSPKDEGQEFQFLDSKRTLSSPVHCYHKGQSGKLPLFLNSCELHRHRPNNVCAPDQPLTILVCLLNGHQIVRSEKPRLQSHLVLVRSQGDYQQNKMGNVRTLHSTYTQVNNGKHPLVSYPFPLSPEAGYSVSKGSVEKVDP